MHRFEKPNNSSILIIELSLYQDQNKWKHYLIPLEVNENESNRVVDLLIFKYQYVLIEKIHLFLDNHICNFACRRSLSSFSSQNVLNKHKQRRNQQETTIIRTSNESRLYWKKHFPKNPLYSPIYSDFEDDNEIDTSNIGNKPANKYKQNPICNRYYLVCEWA